MGQAISSTVEDVKRSRYLTPGELREYQELTFLNKKEICHIHKVFIKILPMGTNFREAKLSAEQICTLPGLRVNPYRDRLCKIFSDEEGVFPFEHFLEMASVFSKQASLDVKVQYAFRIFDFNDSAFIEKDDIRSLIQRVINRNDTPVEILDYVVQQIMKEADLNNDNLISVQEFEHGISKAPDFLQSFSVQF
ncbi:calcium and integrin-binding family member 4 isoform X2 [Lissotriton helveticus]